MRVLPPAFLLLVAPAAFANTIEALDGAGRLLEKATSVFQNLSSAETSDALQAIQKQVAPMLAAHRDDVRLDPALFARVRAVWDARATLTLDPDQQKLLEDAWKDFVRGGALLPKEGQERLRKINAELAGLSVRFGNNLLKETNAYRLVIERKEDLAGLPERVVAGGAEAAKKAGLEGKWVFTLQAPSLWPFLQGADNRELRRIWAEVLDADAFQAFQEKDLFDPATARSFRTNVLERGGSEEAMTLYVRFRGREPSIEPLLERRGLK